MRDIVNKIINIIDKYDMNHDSVGKIVMIIHIIGAIIGTSLVIFTKQKIILWILLILIIMWIMSVKIFGGCILSILEIKLSRSNYTIIDPILKIFGMTISNKNRKNITILGIIILLTVVIVKLVR